MKRRSGEEEDVETSPEGSGQRGRKRRRVSPIQPRLEANLVVLDSSKDSLFRSISRWIH